MYRQVITQNILFITTPHPYTHLSILNFGEVDNEEDDTYNDFNKEDDLAIVVNEEEMGGC